MSVQWMAEVWEHGPDDPMDRFVLLKLADNADQSGYCFPSQSDICAKTRLSESTVRRSIARLESEGWMTVVRGVGKGKHSHYQLLHKVSERKVSDRKVSPGKVSHRPSKGVTQTNPLQPLFGVTIMNHQSEFEKDSLVEYLEAWNELRGTLPKCLKLTKDRREMLLTRIAEGLTLESFRTAVETCAATPFLRGEGKDRWIVKFDWLLANDANMTKVLEGNYGPPEQPGALVTGYLPDDPYGGPEYQTAQGVEL